MQKGQNEIIAEGLAQITDPQSIQAGGTGDFTIMDVQYKLSYPEPVDVTQLPTDIQKKIKIIEDSLLDVSFKLKDITNQKDVLNIQKTILLNNKLLKGEGKSDSLLLLTQAIEYYDKKLNAIYSELLALEKKELIITKEQDRLSRKLFELNNYWQQQNITLNNNQPISQIIITVFAEASTTGKLDINYISANAGWYATYDLRQKS